MLNVSFEMVNPKETEHVRIWETFLVNILYANLKNIQISWGIHWMVNGVNLYLNLYSALLPLLPHAQSHTRGGSAAKHWWQPMTTRCNMGFGVLLKSTLHMGGQSGNQACDLENRG